MGRVSRYRKVAKDDPFAPKRAEKVDTTINFEPGKKELQETGSGMTRSVKRMIQAQERMRRNSQAERFAELSDKAKARPANKLKFQYISAAQKSGSLEFKEGETKKSEAPQIEGMKDDETYHEFTKRMRETTREKTKGRIVQETHRREKTKDYFEKQREKKLKRKFGDNSDDEKDEREGKVSDFTKLQALAPKFGEQAQRPPSFSKLPKNSQKVDMAIAKRVKESGGYSEPLMAFKEKKKAASMMAKLSDFDTSHLTNADGSSPSIPISSSSSKPSQAQTPDQKEAMAALRERVQSQYRELKASRLEEKKRQQHATTSSDRSQQKKKRSNPFVFSKEDMERFQEMRPESKRGMKKAKRRDEWLHR